MKNTLNVEAAGDREIVVTRQFDAPRPVVWEAMTKPELLRRWMAGPPGWELTTCEDEQVVGGSFRCVWAGPDGAELSMTGVYREIVPGERCTRTEVFNGPGMPPMAEQLATLVLADAGEGTALTITLLYDSKEARDGAVASGMEHGMAASYDRLDGVLETASA